MPKKSPAASLLRRLAGKREDQKRRADALYLATVQRFEDHCESIKQPFRPMMTRVLRSWMRGNHVQNIPASVSVMDDEEGTREKPRQR